MAQCNSNVRWVRCGYIIALVLTCFWLTKGRVTFFRPATIVARFLHLIVLFYKIIINYTSKRQFVVLLCCTNILTFEIVLTKRSFNCFDFFRAANGTSIVEIIPCLLAGIIQKGKATRALQGQTFEWRHYYSTVRVCKMCVCHAEFMLFPLFLMSEVFLASQYKLNIEQLQKLMRWLEQNQN